jgi:hypothetical protein
MPVIVFVPTLFPFSGQQVTCVLKRLHQLKEKALRGSTSSRTGRGLMTLKIVLGMEWMLILGGDLGLYTYLFFLVLFAPKYCNGNGYHALLHFLSSIRHRTVRIIAVRATINSSAR